MTSSGRHRRTPRPTAPESIDIDQWDDRILVSSPIPLHAQLLEILVDHLRHDGYPPGTVLPTQASLVHRFNLGRPSVRRAVESLIAGGYVARVPRSDRLIVQAPPVRLAPPVPCDRPGGTAP